METGVVFAEMHGKLRKCNKMQIKGDKGKNKLIDVTPFCYNRYRKEKRRIYETSIFNCIR